MGDEDGAWIVGVDGSDSAEHALRWATTHAAGRAKELRIVSAWQAPLYGPYPVVGPMTSPYDTDALREAAQREATRIAEEAATRVEMTVEPIAAHGGAASVLLDASEHSSLLVLGNRGRGGFTRLLLGSTSNQVATHAVVPTVIVPHDSRIDAAHHLLVGIDGSANSLAALDWAIGFVAPGDTVDVVWVWDTAPLAVGADQFFFPEATDLASERFDHVLAGIAEQVSDAGIILEHEFIRGSPRTSLLDCSKRADLLVVGARGHGAIASALLGSVSSWLLHHVHQPIVVVPFHGSAGPADEAVDGHERSDRTDQQ